MLEFSPETFTELLHAIPEAIPYCEEPQHSEYLQKEVFDKLGKGETIDLTKDHCGGTHARRRDLLQGDRESGHR